jgi:hypothetical protein
MGVIMAVVAVLVIHMDRKPVVTMKPSNNLEEVNYFQFHNITKIEEQLSLHRHSHYSASASS